MATTRKFLVPNGKMTTQPPRQLRGTLEHVDTKETVERIAEAASLYHEPECVSKAIIDAQTDLARTYDRLRHLAGVEQAQQIRRELSIEARMADAHRRAKQRHVDASHELHIMRRDLDRARRGGVTQPPAVVARLERLEAQLDHRPDLEAA